MSAWVLVLFDASAAVALDTDADATLYISTTNENTFKFSTESTNFDDVSVNDVRYYVWDQWTGFTDASLNVVNAQVLWRCCNYQQQICGIPP
jgi:hypothetical protein